MKSLISIVTLVIASLSFAVPAFAETKAAPAPKAAVVKAPKKVVKPAVKPVKPAVKAAPKAHKPVKATPKKK